MNEERNYTVQLSLREYQMVQRARQLIRERSSDVLIIRVSDYLDKPKPAGNKKPLD